MNKFKFQNVIYDGFLFTENTVLTDYQIKIDDKKNYYIVNKSELNKDKILEEIRNYIYIGMIVLKGTNYFCVFPYEVEEIK